MALPTTRSEMKAFCLRQVGDGAIEINVTDQQVEDCIDWALSYYADYHFDGTTTLFLKHQITEDDKTRGYIEISEDIIGVVELFRIGSGFSTNNMFNIRYQYALNEMFNFTNFSLSNYTMTKEYINLIEDTLVGQKPYRYNRHQNRLYIDMNWDRVAVGEYIIAKCHQRLDPEAFPDIYKDHWLLRYTSVLIRQMWGQNLSKFEGMQLPGGVTLAGERILAEAREDRMKLEDEMINSYSLPVSDLIG